jgi:hypothetical protein
MAADEKGASLKASLGIGRRIGNNPVPRSPLPVGREDVILCLCDRVTRDPALGVACGGVSFLVAGVKESDAAL